MVLTVIAVYVVCWLPYWLFQVDILNVSRQVAAAMRLFQVIMLYVSIMSAWLKTFYWPGELKNYAT